MPQGRPTPKPKPKPKPIPTPPQQNKPPRSPYKDEQYFRTISGEDRNRQSTLNNLIAQEGQAKIGYGFDTDIATNPYSRAALLQKNYDTAQKGTMNSMAAGGQLYSGAHNNARAGNRSNYDANYDSLRKGYDAELARIRDGRQEADDAFRMATEAAGRSAVDRAAKPRPGPSFSPAKRGKRGKPKGKK
jgi:hypothetical protein